MPAIHLHLPDNPTVPLRNATDAYNSHIEHCGWCKNHPFALCGTGQQMLGEIPRVRAASAPR